MKHIATLVLFSLACIQVHSQTTLRVGTGYYIWGTGDLWVNTGELELRKDISQIFSIGLSTDFGHYSSLTNDERLTRSENAFTSISAKPLIITNFIRTDYVGLSLTLGPSVRYFQQMLLSPLLVEGPYGGEEGTFRSERYIVLGGHIRPELHFHLDDKNGMSLAASTTIYNRGEIFSGFSMSFMRRL